MYQLPPVVECISDTSLCPVLLPLQEVAIVSYDSMEGATRAIQVLDGTNMPSGGTLTVRLAPMPAAADPTSAFGAAAGGLGPLSPGAFGHPGGMVNAGGYGGGGDRPAGEGAPNGWEFVASGVGESNIFAQGSGGPGRGLGLGRGAALGRPEGGADMFGLASGGPANSLWGDAGGAAAAGRPPAPVYPAGMRQGVNRSPSPGAAGGLAFGAGSGGTSPGLPRQPQVHTASPVPGYTSGDLFAKPGFNNSDALGFGGGSGDQSQGFTQGFGLGGAVHGSGSGLGGLDVGASHAEGNFGLGHHMISPAGDSGGTQIRRGVGSGGSLNAQSVGSGVGSGSDV